MDVAFLLPDVDAGGKRDVMTSRAHEKSGAPRLGLATGLAARVLAAQLAVSVVLAAVFWAMGGLTPGYSALLGGLTSVIPNAFLALRLAAPHRVGLHPGAVALLRAAWMGELGKVALTVLMFGIVFTQVEPLAAGPLFAGFIAAQLVILAGFLMRDDDDQPVVARGVSPGRGSHDGEPSEE